MSSGYIIFLCLYFFKFIRKLSDFLAKEAKTRSQSVEIYVWREKKDTLNEEAGNIGYIFFLWLEKLCKKLRASLQTINGGGGNQQQGILDFI